MMRTKDNEPCRYCGGPCPTEYARDNDSDSLCDGFAGDIDGLYSDDDDDDDDNSGDILGEEFWPFKGRIWEDVQ